MLLFLLISCYFTHNALTINENDNNISKIISENVNPSNI